MDLAISAGRGLSRRAGVIAATPEGAWIANISKTHALYVAGDGYRIRLPRVEGDGDPAGGWLVHAGTAMVGSRSMLDDGLQIAVTVPGRHRRPPAGSGRRRRGGGGQRRHVLPLYLDPKTKLFLVALMWCRPWLLDPSATSPLPRTPEIARAALEATGAHHELDGSTPTLSTATACRRESPSISRCCAARSPTAGSRARASACRMRSPCGS